MDFFQLFLLSLYLQIFGIIWNLIILGIIGGLIYAFRNRIKRYLINLMREAIRELKDNGEI